jgi:predicted porin
MKKTMIAMAVAAAMPVAAQADVTLSGSVSTSFENSTTASKTLDIDAALTLSSTEVLTNGMTATATFGILGDSDDDTDNAGKVSLSGDFGTLTVGNKLDRDGAFQSGNIGNGIGPVALYETSDSASTSNAVHYAGEMAGLSVQAQINASTDATETAVTNNGASTQLAATYVFNGLTIGYATTNADIATKNGTSGKVVKKGNTAGAAYSFGDLTVAYGKASTSDDGVASASYSTNVGDVAVSASVIDWGTSSSNSATASYTMDALTLSLSYSNDKGNSGSKMITSGTKTTKMSATYVAGNMTTVVGSQWDGAVDLSVALDLGNADLSVKREGQGDAATSVAKTSLKYSVAF